MKEVNDLTDEELIQVYPALLKELKNRGIIRTNNLVGELGEHFVISHYNSDPSLPNLQLAPESTQNVDALSRNGERYAVKTIKGKSRTTGVFYGLNDIEDIGEEKQKFEYAIVVKLDEDLAVEKILELDWKTFLKHKKWHSRMKAWNLNYTNVLIKAGKIVCKKE